MMSLSFRANRSASIRELQERVMEMTGGNDALKRNKFDNVKTLVDARVGLKHTLTLVSSNKLNKVINFLYQVLDLFKKIFLLHAFFLLSCFFWSVARVALEVLILFDCIRLEMHSCERRLKAWNWTRCAAS